MKMKYSLLGLLLLSITIFAPRTARERAAQMRQEKQQVTGLIKAAKNAPNLQQLLATERQFNQIAARKNLEGHQIDFNKTVANRVEQQLEKVTKALKAATREIKQAVNAAQFQIQSQANPVNLKGLIESPNPVNAFNVNELALTALGSQINVAIQKVADVIDRSDNNVIPLLNNTLQKKYILISAIDKIGQEFRGFSDVLSNNIYGQLQTKRQQLPAKNKDLGINFVTIFQPSLVKTKDGLRAILNLKPQ